MSVKSKKNLALQKIEITEHILHILYFLKNKNTCHYLQTYSKFPNPLEFENIHVHENICRGNIKQNLINRPKWKISCSFHLRALL